ncbi:MAG: cytochrome c biogenesis protein CcsA [Verrucomicrobia bacterium]|jgi:ABC-type transport system involved in cytochrome c biogenesis permease subunit|nr:cytochrome c biogenesis protein CcsA [Verrucomicrobiota bacterium]MBT5063138.1 cytochrome c biogenesis protein CcsA [Verrucomicrobiota bacterium]MBT5480699.1 cytochrome c biogenesis protein CcsA [Verrucomicrobiota bacterium]MBT6239069.1 cytochrome c biogenesis protein CcsA [Verrucomicrobiota bacterium]MBT6803574.1 cytochrome c biogenesis protein CcsA [Verrucomicrobiota bacterium]
MRKLLPYLLLGLFTLWIVSALRTPKSKGYMDDVSFGQLPVLREGRLQPLDSVGMNALIQIRGTRKVPLEGNNEKGEWGAFLKIRGEGSGQLSERRWYQFGKRPKKLNASEWLMEVMMHPEIADERYIFAVNHPDLLDELGLDDQGVEKSGLFYFTFHEISEHFPTIRRHAQSAFNQEAALRTPFEKAVIKVWVGLNTYMEFKNTIAPQDSHDFNNDLEIYLSSIAPGLEAWRSQNAGTEHDETALDLFSGYMDRFQHLSSAGTLLIPPSKDSGTSDQWSTMGTNLIQAIQTMGVRPAVRSYAKMASAFHGDNSGNFNQAASQYKESLKPDFGTELKRTSLEFSYNKFSPFYKSTVIYLIAFLFACSTWFNGSEWTRKTAFYLIVLSAIVHTGGLITRMYIEGRPPVTNLYSSAVFVGWGAVLLGLVIERIYKDGVGAAIASIVGVLSLIVAHNLALSGDTMGVLRAVLDTNFWLATHVVIITLGYASTFFSGFLAIVYIMRGFFTKSLDKDTSKSLTRMVYGVVCFSTLFSFVGTILGGIWADQSWGRFWGWDPKENGALLIVIWNAIILHARWGGMIRERGLMNLAVFGNIVTAFSWFGVNMLNVGLHSYGFMDAAFKWLMIFNASQILIMAIGIMPLSTWASFRTNTTKAA